MVSDGFGVSTNTVAAQRCIYIYIYYNILHDDESIYGMMLMNLLDE